MGRSLVVVVLIGTLSGCQALPAPLAEPIGPLASPPSDPAMTDVAPRDTLPSVPSRSSVEPQAREHLSQYLAVTDAITSRGGQNPEEMTDLVTPDWHVEEKRGFAEFERQGIRTLGRTTHHHALVQSVRALASGELEVAVFSCVDTRSVWVVPSDTPDPPDGLEQWLDDGSPALADEEDFPDAWQDYIQTASPRPGGIDPVLFWFRGPTERALMLDFTDTWRGHHPCSEE